MVQKEQNKLFAFCNELGKFLINVATAAFVLVFITPLFDKEFLIIESVFDLNAAIKTILAVLILCAGIFLKTLKP